MQIQGPANPASSQGATQLDQSLQVGGQYRAVVTAVRAGQAEILIGSRYLTASTPLPLTSGQVLLLELISEGKAGLVFRLIQGTDDNLRRSDNSAGLLRTAGAPVDGRSQEALALLNRHSIPATATVLRQAALILDALGPLRCSAFMPEWRACLSRGLDLPDSVLLQIAYSATANSAAAALAPYGQQQGRRGHRDRRAPARTEPEGTDVEDLADSATLRATLASSVGSPEHALLIALSEHAGQRNASVDLALPVPQTGHSNADEAAMRHWAEAQRIRAAADPETLRFILPLNLDGEAAALGWEQHELGGDYYDKEVLLRLKLLNDTQGRIDIMLHSKGLALRLDICGESPAVVNAYRTELPQLIAELAELGQIVTSASVSRQNLPA